MSVYLSQFLSLTIYVYLDLISLSLSREPCLGNDKVKHSHNANNDVPHHMSSLARYDSSNLNPSFLAEIGAGVTESTVVRRGSVAGKAAEHEYAVIGRASTLMFAREGVLKASTVTTSML